MMSELTRLRDEADRLLTTYFEYRHCDDHLIRTRVHVDLDRFLMQNRETAMILLVVGLENEIQQLVSENPVKYGPKDNIFSKVLKRLKPKKKEDQDEDEWMEDPDEPKYFSNS